VEENQHLKQFKDKYHDVDKRLAALKETLKPLRTNEFLSSVCLATGSAGLGATQTFLALSSYGWYVFVGLSAPQKLADPRPALRRGINRYAADHRLALINHLIKLWKQP
jgi:hypothetical protein